MQSAKGAVEAEVEDREAFERWEEGVREGFAQLRYYIVEDWRKDGPS